jgi:hypothetical protein
MADAASVLIGDSPLVRELRREIATVAARNVTV